MCSKIKYTKIYNKYDDGGYKTPIANPVIPKSQDPNSIRWLANWLNNRRSQIWENMHHYDMTNNTYNKPESEKRGDIRKDGFSVSYNSDVYNPILDTMLFRDAKRLAVNRKYYSILNNAASAPEINVNTEEGDSPYYGIVGMYVKPNYFNNTGHYIAYKGNQQDRVKIHERTHAMNFKGAENKIRDLISEINNFVPKPDKYLDSPEEVYARLNEYRFDTKLSPSKVIDKKYLDTHREQLKKHSLSRYSDDFLMRLFNEVAVNTTSKDVNGIDGLLNYIDIT